MTRGARLDAQGTLNHFLLRGIERGNIVYDDEDREDFLARMTDQAQATETCVYAWALMDNQAHILLCSGTEGMPVFMRRFMTGCAVAFNRLLRAPVSESVQIHRLRGGRLFQGAGALHSFER